MAQSLSSMETEKSGMSILRDLKSTSRLNGITEDAKKRAILRRAITYRHVRTLASPAKPKELGFVVVRLIHSLDTFGLCPAVWIINVFGVVLGNLCSLGHIQSLFIREVRFCQQSSLDSFVSDSTNNTIT